MKAQMATDDIKKECLYDPLKKWKLLIMIPLLAVTISSCSHYYYVPNVKNVPLLTEKNEGRVSINYGEGDESKSIDIQAAYAITDNIAVMSNFMSARGGESSSYNWAKGTNFEGAVGYFKPINTFAVFEVYGGLGVNSQHHQYSTYTYNSWGSSSMNAGFADLKYTKLFLQPSFGVTFKWADLAFSVPVSSVFFNNINANTYNNEGLDMVVNNPTSFLLEPAITARVGWKYVKLQCQYVHLINLTKQDLPFEQDKISFGVYFSLGRKYGKDSK